MRYPGHNLNKLGRWPLDDAYGLKWNTWFSWFQIFPIWENVKQRTLGRFQVWPKGNTFVTSQELHVLTYVIWVCIKLRWTRVGSIRLKLSIKRIVMSMWSTDEIDQVYLIFLQSMTEMYWTAESNIVNKVILRENVLKCCKTAK